MERDTFKQSIARRATYKKRTGQKYRYNILLNSEASATLGSISKHFRLSYNNVIERALQVYSTSLKEKPKQPDIIERSAMTLGNIFATLGKTHNVELPPALKNIINSIEDKYKK
jgi:hypothetical protein